MKKYISFLILTVFFVIYSLSISAQSIFVFDVVSPVVTNGKIVVSNTNVATPISFDVIATTLRDLATSGPFACDMVITLVYEKNGIVEEISSPTSIANNKYSSNFLRTDPLRFLGSLPANRTGGVVKLKYSCFDYVTSQTQKLTKYSTGNYQVTLAAGPVVGTPPSFMAPEVGSVPLYEYVSGLKRQLTTVYYSSYPGFTYNGIFGYVFTSAKTGTVPLMRYSHPSNGNSYYTITPTTTSGYNYEGIVCFVYDNQITNSFPVYENYSSSLGSFHRYSISNELFSSYIFGGVKFYILQNQPPPTVDYSTYLTTINSFVFVSGGKHKLNQSTYQGSDWRHEGANFRGYTVQVPGTVPIYELLPNAENDIYYSHQTTDHYWVKNKGVVFYAHKTQVPGTIPIYDYTNQYYMDHFASPSYNIPDPYWIRHGISFYAFPLN